MLDFDPNREAPAPRDAATLVPLRDGSEGLEVFCVRRHERSGFLGGAIVFPGGKVDAADRDGAWAPSCRPLSDRARLLTDGADGAIGRSALPFAVAACREALEEAGLLPVEAEAGSPEPGSSLVPALLAELAAGRGLREALEARGLRLAVDRLLPFARWVTPVAEARRFDARFFLLPAPDGQDLRCDGTETTQGFWARPDRVIQRFLEGELWLAPPTLRTLELLAGAGDLAGASALAERQSLAPVCPVFVAGEGDALPFLALPGDPAHPVSERRVDGATRFVLRDGRFLSQAAPRSARAANDEPSTWGQETP